MRKDDLRLRKTERAWTIHHALSEAMVCVDAGALCAGLAMLRKAIDLWSAECRDRFGLVFDKAAGERDTMYWRLRKIAEGNPLYHASVHAVIDGLRLDANDALHDDFTCPLATNWEAIEVYREPYVRLTQAVVSVVAFTDPTAHYIQSALSRPFKRPGSK